MRVTFAYMVMVQGKKRFGGTATAESVTAAARVAARRCGLVAVRNEYTSKWTLDDKTASLAIWVGPEHIDYND